MKTFEMVFDISVIFCLLGICWVLVKFIFSEWRRDTNLKNSKKTKDWL